MAPHSDLIVLSATDVAQITSSFDPSELQIWMSHVFVSLTHKRQLRDRNASRTDADVAVEKEHERPGTQTPQRTAISMHAHTALWMPARFCTPDISMTSMKIVCVPKAGGDGLPATTVVLNENTGSVRAIVNARKLTGLRNAAGSLLSTCLSASRYPLRIVAYGAGHQVEAHLDLFVRFFVEVNKCTIVNRTLNQRADSLMNLLEERHPSIAYHLYASSEKEHLPGIEAAVREADLIVCATSATEPLFPSEWVGDGTHVVLIGSYTPRMKEVGVELVRRAAGESVGHGRLFVDSKESCLVEAGELLAAGIPSKRMVEIGEVVPTLKSGAVDVVGLLELLQSAKDLPRGDDARGHTGPVTMFKSVGVGLQDVVLAKAVVEQAEKHGIGQMIMGYD